MSTSWLTKQRKHVLIDLATEANLPLNSDLRKDEIVETLDDHLQSNSTRLSRNPVFEGYYGVNLPRRTPGKARGSSTARDDGPAEVKSVVTARGRRTTAVKSEIDDLNDRSYIASPSQQLTTKTPTSRTSTSNALTTRTPRTVGRPRRSELPPSPADIADDVEYTTARLSTSLSSWYATSSLNLTASIETVRENLSSVHAVHTTLLLLEALALQREILPWRHAFDIPPLAVIGTPSIPVALPDLFLLLTGFFWSTTLLWAATNVVVPLVFAYFYNLSTTTVRRGGQRVQVARYTADPLTFSVVKAVTTYVVYERGYSWGLWGGQVSYRVEHAVFGGWWGMLIGSGVGGLAGLYEAAQGR